MAKLVGVFAASHAPLIARDWFKISPTAKESITAAFEELGRRVKAARPDVLVVVAPDHWSNFFLNNFPTVCVGVGVENDGPPEDYMQRVFPKKTLTGDQTFALHIVESALRNGFDPAVSHRMRLDHGFCLPIWQMNLDPIPRVVPIALNCLEAPLPSMQRCFQWGQLLASAARSFPGDIRVAILGTGGLSHSIGESTMGEIDEAFDRSCIDLFGNSPKEKIFEELETRLQTTGNGGNEVRNWVVAHGAAAERGFDLIKYAPIGEVYVGCGLAEWRFQSDARGA